MDDSFQTPELMLAEAKRALRQGAFVRARRLARTAIHLKPDAIDGWLILAGLSRRDPGEAYLRRALILDPSNAIALRAAAWFKEQGRSQPQHEVSKKKATMQSREDLASIEPGRRLIRGPLRESWRSFRRHKAAVIGLAIVLAFIVLAIAAPILTPYPPNMGDFRHIREAPLTRFEPTADQLAACHWRGTLLEAVGCRIYIAGTDRIGRDLYSRTVYATRTSLLVAFVAAAVSLLIGVSYGTIAGFLGGQVDEYMMRFVDLLYSLPVFLIVLGIQSFFRLFWMPSEGLISVLDTINRRMGGLLFLFIAIGAVNWVGMARMARAMVYAQKGRDYILAARAVGASELDIMLRHLLPNTLGPLIILESLSIPGYIFLEATLSFIGLGVHSTVRGGTAGLDLPSWGVMIREGYPGIRTSPYLILLPGIALTILTLGFNFLGDGLRDAMDPHSRQVAK